MSKTMAMFIAPRNAEYQCGARAAGMPARPCSGGGWTEPQAASVNRAEPLVEASPRPWLDLHVPLLGLGTGLFQILKPRIGFLDLKQFFC